MPFMRVKPGLRSGLLLAMLPVLLLPLVGLWFVGQMAELTRSERRQTLDDATRNFAAALHERTDLLGDTATKAALPGNIEALPVALISRAVIDGLDDEWDGVQGREVPSRPLPGVPGTTLQISIAVARSQEQAGDFFLLVKARDERFLPAVPTQANGQLPVGDDLRVWVGDTPDNLREIDAVMFANADGWFTETTLPPSSRFLRIEVIDVDYQASRKLEATAKSALFGLVSPALPADGLEQLRSAQMESRWANALRGFERAGMRVAVYERSGQLLARLGSLVDAEPPAGDLLSSVAARLLSLAVGLSADFNAVDQDLAPLASALTGLPAQQSLRLAAGSGGAYWLTTSAHPIWIDDRVAGALVLEQTDVSDLASGQKALEWLALLAAVAISATVVALLALSSMTVSRIVRLRDAADAAIDARGRVIGSIPPFRWHDEVGSLALGYERVLDRLREHQQYLANLRGRLVHELRTPIMVVRSSLENMQDEQTALAAGLQADGGATSRGDAAFVERALGGTMRLEKIVSSMSEAASLESMLSDSQLECVDLISLLTGLAQAYESAYPASVNHQDQAAGVGRAPRFAVSVAPGLVDGDPLERSLDDDQALAMIVPETIAQALDKLISNAVDYALPGTEILLELGRVPTGRLAPVGGGFVLAVSNQGPSLPEQMTNSLFESMVSVRGAGANDQSHLGLGLYLVRLIAEFHGGSAFAENLADGVRVGFTISSGR